MSDPEIIDLLATVPLFTGIERPDLAEFARIMRRRVIPEGEVLWRQGDEATEMLVMVDGADSMAITGSDCSRRRGTRRRRRIVARDRARSR